MENISLLLFQDTELIGILIKIIVLVAFTFLLFRKLPERYQKTEKKKSSLDFVKTSKPQKKLTKKDFFILSIAMICYGVISFTKLGSITFPVTTWQPQSTESNQSFILELDEYTHFDYVYVLYGEGDNNANPDRYQLGVEDMLIEGSNDLETWEVVTKLEKGSIYEYTMIQGNWDYQYIRITAANKNQSLTEIGFKQFHTDSFLSVSVYQDAYQNSQYPASLVIDEQDKLVIDPTFYDEAYFDEIYHPRNAWEIANSEHMYATVHPLFGTNIMALFIKLFGMSPFIWRLPGAIFGLLIIPMFYMILHLLFKDYRLKILGIVLCSADFMHLTTSRIGTLEPFSIFFILLMFNFMIRYFFTSFYDTDFKKTIGILAIDGICMGIAIATKWTACYSAVGLAMILFTNFAMRFIEFRKAKKICNDTSSFSDEQIQEAQYIVTVFPKYITITILLCFVFFIFIPVIIYCLAYLPDHVWRGDTWSISNVWSQTLYMYNYHTNLEATHPYQSTWYQWLLDIRPIWYYSGVKAEGISHSIACFSNPLLCWVGLPCIIYTIYRAIRYHSQTAWIIVIGYMTALLPWVSFVERCVFAYHFYPTSFFTMLAIVYFFSQVLSKDSRWEYILYIFISCYIFLFVLFLPVTAGFGTTKTFIKFLEWFPTWYFG